MMSSTTPASAPASSEEEGAALGEPVARPVDPASSEGLGVDEDAELCEGGAAGLQAANARNGRMRRRVDSRSRATTRFTGLSMGFDAGYHARFRHELRRDGASAQRSGSGELHVAPVSHECDLDVRAL